MRRSRAITAGLVTIASLGLGALTIAPAQAAELSITFDRPSMSGVVTAPAGYAPLDHMYAGASFNKQGAFFREDCYIKVDFDPGQEQADGSTTYNYALTDNGQGYQDPCLRDYNGTIYASATFGNAWNAPQVSVEDSAGDLELKNDGFSGTNFPVGAQVDVEIFDLWGKPLVRDDKQPVAFPSMVVDAAGEISGSYGESLDTRSTIVATVQPTVGASYKLRSEYVPSTSSPVHWWLNQASDIPYTIDIQKKTVTFSVPDLRWSAPRKQDPYKRWWMSVGEPSDPSLPDAENASIKFYGQDAGEMLSADRFMDSDDGNGVRTPIPKELTFQLDESMIGKKIPVTYFSFFSELWHSSDNFRVPDLWNPGVSGYVTATSIDATSIDAETVEGIVRHANGTRDVIPSTPVIDNRATIPVLKHADGDHISLVGKTPGGKVSGEWKTTIHGPSLRATLGEDRQTVTLTASANTTLTIDDDNPIVDIPDGSEFTHVLPSPLGLNESATLQVVDPESGLWSRKVTLGAPAAPEATVTGKLAPGRIIVSASDAVSVKGSIEHADGTTTIIPATPLDGGTVDIVTSAHKVGDKISLIATNPDGADSKVWATTLVQPRWSVSLDADERGITVNFEEGAEFAYTLDGARASTAHSGSDTQHSPLSRKLNPEERLTVTFTQTRTGITESFTLTAKAAEVAETTSAAPETSDTESPTQSAPETSDTESPVDTSDPTADSSSPGSQDSSTPDDSTKPSRGSSKPSQPSSHSPESDDVDSDSEKPGKDTNPKPSDSDSDTLPRVASNFDPSHPTNIISGSSHDATSISVTVTEDGKVVEEGSTRPDTDGTWEYNFQNLPTSGQEVSVYATDNRGQKSKILNFTIGGGKAGGDDLANTGVSSTINVGIGLGSVAVIAGALALAVSRKPKRRH